MNHILIDTGIDLSEVHRMVLHGQIKLIQAVAQALTITTRRFRPDAVHRIRALGLQIDMQVMGLAKGNQFFPVFGNQFVHVTEHHGRHIITTGHFYLGNPVEGHHTMQQFPQGLDAITNTRVQHHTTVNIR